MSDVRAKAGVPLIADFAGIGAPTLCAPVVVDSNTGYIYTCVSGQSVFLAATGGGGGTGTVTHTLGALTASALVVGNGGADIDVLASLGTTSTVLHGNAAGRPTFGAVALGTDVSGTLLAAQFPALTNDVTTSAGSLSTTIANNVVTNAKLAQMAANTIKGNNTGSTANALDLTVAETLTLLGIGSAITNSISGDVALNNTANYFTGPTVAQGSTGTWWVSGTVTCVDTAGAAAFNAKLWDGTTVIASTADVIDAANRRISFSLSGFISAPAGNLRISVRDLDSTSGAILANNSGNAKDSTISAFRIA